MNKIFKKIFLVVLLLSILNVIFIPNKLKAQSVNVNATVPGCVLNLTAKPEKRIPRINNWATILNVEILKNGSHLFSFIVNTDNFGKATIDLCSKNFYPVPGNYDFYLRGYSHLLKKYYNIAAFNSYNTYVDFSANNSELIAGETSIVYDNYINALDLSTQIRNLYTGDYKNDLNQDGIVNSLDVSITIINFYKKGD